MWKTPCICLLENIHEKGSVTASMDENVKNYIDTRFDPQVDWYDKKALNYKRLSQILNVITLVGGILTPIFGIGGFRLYTLISAVTVAIGLALLKYFKFEELWQVYRHTHESLIREKILFLQQVDVYAHFHAPEKLFIERVESILGEEHGSWYSLFHEKE